MQKPKLAPLPTGIALCPVCDGTGTKRQTDAAGSREYVRCTECRGRGWIKTCK